MTKFRAFLIGILLGQVLLLPTIYHLIQTPRIEAEEVPDCYRYVNQVFIKHIKGLHNKYHLGGDTLTIYLAPQPRVQLELKREFDNTTEVMGFYNTKTNTIWCVYDPLVLIHEIRHVTEGEFHR